MAATGMLVHELFEAQVRKTPDNVALTFAGSSLTYRELNLRANQLACHLRTLGVRPESLAGICMERSPELVVAILGILKAGGACMPLDPAYPRERLAFMLDDSCPLVVLTEQKLLPQLPETIRYPPSEIRPAPCALRPPTVICLDAEWESIAQLDPGDLPGEAASDNLSFVFYTSGSTGQPKAVMWSHTKRDGLQSWQQATYQLTEQDRHLLKSSVGFTLLSKEIFLPLLTGAQMTIVPAGLDRDAPYLVKLMAQHKITMITVVPSMLRMLLEQEDIETCTSLRHVCTFGESLPVSLQERFFSRLSAELTVNYGATEAPTAASFRCDRTRPQPIIRLGQPLPGKEIYLLDECLQAVPIGVCGEIYLGGKLARGYFKRPDLTAEKFIPHPFTDKPGARLYRTGDLGRSLPEGNIEFVGRADNQIKIRGFRIELREIEATLAQHPGVMEAVVLAREEVEKPKSAIPKTTDDRRRTTDDRGKTTEDGGPRTEEKRFPSSPQSAIRDPQFSAKRLVAYIVTKENQPTAASDLRSFLKRKLPDYMIPSTFMVLDSMPLSPNGKIDRLALPEPDSVRPELKESFVAPRNAAENTVAEIWAQVLQMDRVGIHDNFFDLGGHSLLATQVMSRLRGAFQIEIPLSTLFEHPTVGELVVYIQAQAKNSASGEMADLLADLESLSDEEAERLLAREGEKSRTVKKI